MLGEEPRAGSHRHLGWEGGGPSSAPGVLSCYKRKKFLSCPSCILLLYPPLCYQVPLPSAAPRFQRRRLICTCTRLPRAEPTGLKGRHPTLPVPHPRAAVAPGDLVSTFHKTSQILLAFQPEESGSLSEYSPSFLQFPLIVNL